MTIALLAVVSVAGMALKDVLGTFLVIAEAKDRKRLAGALDAAGDGVTFGLGALVTTQLQDGRLGGALILGVVMATSYFSTSWATGIANSRLGKSAA